MITDLKRKTIRQHLIMCASMGICRDVATPTEWAQLMGWKGHANFAALNVAQTGRDLNKEMGYDYIREHFPLWSNNKKYRPIDN